MPRDNSWRATHAVELGLLGQEDRHEQLIRGQPWFWLLGHWRQGGSSTQFVRVDVNAHSCGWSWSNTRNLRRRCVRSFAPHALPKQRQQQSKPRKKDKHAPASIRGGGGLLLRADSLLARASNLLTHAPAGQLKKRSTEALVVSTRGQNSPCGCSTDRDHVSVINTANAHMSSCIPNCNALTHCAPAAPSCSADKVPQKRQYRPHRFPSHFR